MKKEHKQEIEKTTKKTLHNAVYQVNAAKKAVTCHVISKGEKIYGYAKCGPNDEFDVERGKEIAAYRVEIAQRKRDLAVTNTVIEDLQGIINNHEEYVKQGYLKRSQVSKHWEEFLRIACDERKRQLENIHFCEKELKKLCK